MLWRRSQTAEKRTEFSVNESTESLVMKPNSKVVQLRPSLDEYAEFAKQMNFIPGKLIEALIYQFMATHDIPVYDYEEVDAYLRQKAEMKGLIWIWRPLREKDIPKDFIWLQSINNFRVFKDGARRWVDADHGHYHHGWDHRPYDKPVPLKTLKRMKLIEDQFPTALFFVSDYAVPHPDPFMMVTKLDVDKIIFDAWDEPEFGV